MLTSVWQGAIIMSSERQTQYYPGRVQRAPGEGQYTTPEYQVPNTVHEGDIIKDDMRAYRIDHDLDGKDPKTLRRRLMGAVLGLSVAAGALGLGVGAAVHAIGEKTEPKQQPTAGAPAVPGEQGPAPTETDPYANLNMQTFPFEIEGQTYEGAEALKQAYGVSVAEYPDAEAATRRIFEVIDVWQNNRLSPEYEARFGTYSSKDGQRAASGAIEQDFINPAFTEILSGTPQPGTNTEGMRSPDWWFKEQAELVYQNDGYRYQTKDDAVPYKSTYTISNVNVHGEVAGQAAVTVTGMFVDNGDQNTIGEMRSRPEGYQGVTEPKTEQPITYHLTLGQSPDGYWEIISVQ